MVVVLPVCHKDKEAALRNLAWAKELDGGVSFPCLVSHEIGFDANDVISAAHGYFSSVQVHQYRPLSRKPLPWPQPQNWAWKQALIRVRKSFNEPWFWWEQDAIPLKAGWLKSLSDAYATSGKAFLGAMGDDNGGQVQKHLNGVAVYPPDVLTHGPSAMYSCNTIAFDVLGGWRVLQQASITPLIQHVWSWHDSGGRPSCTFRSDEDLEKVSKEAVLFHRCKDKTLIEMLCKTTQTTLATPKEKSQQRAYVCMGRHGDLVNLMPIFIRSACSSGMPTQLVTSNEFKPFVAESPWIESHAIMGNAGDLSKGISYARSEFKAFTVVQVFGDNKTQSKDTSNYNKDAWKMAGALKDFSDETLIPIFPERSPAREQRIIDSVTSGLSKRLMLVAISGGYSSPFKQHKLFQDQITKRWSNTFNIVDLCAIRAEKLIDFLGLMDVADVLIASDTVHLHLAAGSNVPTVALLSDRSSWSMTAPRCKVIWKGNYRDAIHRIANINNAIANTANNRFVRPQRKLIHVIEQHKEKLEESIRNTVARKSWYELYKKGVLCSVTKEPYVRDGRIVGDKRTTPFLKDVLKFGMDNARDEDVIFWTNSDTIISELVVETIWKSLDKTPLSTMRRVDHETRKPHPGRDLCAFDAKWLREHWNEIPDFLLGTPEFDNWMALAARRIQNRDSTARQLFDDWYPCDMPHGAISHIDHDPYAMTGPRRYTAPENIYNVKLLRDWCSKNQTGVRFQPNGHVDWSV